MRFIEKISKKSTLLITILLTTYIVFNLFEGERGLISYFEKKKILEDQINLKNILVKKTENLEFKNSLLTDNLDLDYIEILIRKKFLFGKEGENLYIIKSNEN